MPFSELISITCPGLARSSWSTSSLKNPALKGTADAGPARPTVSLTCVPAPFPDRVESLSLSWSPLRELRTFSLP